MDEQTLLDIIPSVDLAEFNSGEPLLKAKFVAEIGSAFTNIGFVALKNHGLSDELREKLYENVQKFFYQEDALKTKYEFPEVAGQRG